MEQEKKKSGYGNPPAFKPGQMPHLGAQTSQCGKPAFLRVEDARALDARVCGRCGLFHVEKVAA